MSRTSHIVVQFFLLVIWALILVSDSTILVSSQTTCIGNQPPYLWENPTRNYWNPNVGTISVKIDSLFATHSPEVPDVRARLEAGTRLWNNVNKCTANIHFIDFSSETFDQADYQSNPPPRHVYFFVTPVATGYFAEEQTVYHGNFAISQSIKIRPHSTSYAATSEFNFTAAHEIGHSFNLANCDAACSRCIRNGRLSKRWTRCV